MNNNLLIGAISGNYTVENIKRWVETSEWEDVDRVLLVYNQQDNPKLLTYLQENKIGVIIPNFDFFGQPLTTVNTNTGNMTPETSYTLVHNLRFFHISQYLEQVDYTKVFTTDVKDVYFNKSPFEKTPESGIVATGEVIRYSEDEWNTRHAITNLGLFGYNLLEEEVYNVGVFGGGKEDVKSLCRDIYLLSCGKPLVADQTSFNYLIRNSYKDKTTLTSIGDYFAIHLHVVANGKVKFDLDNINKYTIVHQYDRL
jgi:hypothetical protein